jgi:ankyrin repeat protein
MRTVAFPVFVLLLVGCFCPGGSGGDSRPEKSKSNDTDPAILKSLHQMVAEGPDETVLKFVKDNPTLVHDMDNYDCTPLHYAARYGRVETARWLIEQKADVNTVSYNQFTPMHVVTDAAVARLLIKAGADLNAKDAWSKTPLQQAAQADRKDICEAILAAGFPIDLATALRLRKRVVVKQMLKENPAIAKEAEGGSDLWANTTPLGVAATQGDKEIVELLLKAGAPIDAATLRPNWGSITALCNAVWASQYEIAVMLCEAGADCNMSGGRGYPRLLDYALKHSDRKMVDLLKKHGGKPSEMK